MTLLLTFVVVLMVGFAIAGAYAIVLNRRRLRDTRPKLVRRENNHLRSDGSQRIEAFPAVRLYRSPYRRDGDNASLWCLSGQVEADRASCALKMPRIFREDP
jgi:hypothetical protein